MNEGGDHGASLFNRSRDSRAQIFSKGGIEDFNEKDGDILRELILKDDPASMDGMIPTKIMRVETWGRLVDQVKAGDVKDGPRFRVAGAGIDNGQLAGPMGQKQHIDPIRACLNNLKIGLRMFGKI